MPVSTCHRSWKKSIVQSYVVRHRIQIREKRNIFNAMRTFQDVHKDCFFPTLGMSVGEYCIWYILNETTRKKKRAATSRANSNKTDDKALPDQSS